MLTKISTGLVLIAVSAVGIGGVIQDLPMIPKNEAKFMERKLEASRDIVAGLAMEDYDKISKSAQDLMLLSHEADWNVIQSQEYFRMSSEFRGSAGRLRDNANAKSLDGATLSYFEVTLSCVRCHKYIRRNYKPKKK